MRHTVCQKCGRQKCFLNKAQDIKVWCVSVAQMDGMVQIFFIYLFIFESEAEN